MAKDRETRTFDIMGTNDEPALFAPQSSFEAGQLSYDRGKKCYVVNYQDGDVETYALDAREGKDLESNILLGFIVPLNIDLDAVQEVRRVFL